MTAPSPRQNRVLPTGEVVADPGRGTLMGNRGCLHTPDGRLGVTRWRSTHWICCVLNWKGWQRDPMPPGRWTALFFLDEVTALAAGHRPCAYCRRGDFLAFAAAWQRATGRAERPAANAMDAQLHAERLRPGRRDQLTRPARVADLPDGAMVRRDGTVGVLREGKVQAWSWAGYAAPQRISRSTTVELLTPPASIAVLAAGYRPAFHPSALG